MKIAIVAPSPVPFQMGGVEKLAIGLQLGFLKYTEILPEIIKLPVDERTLGGTVRAYRSFKNLNLDYFDAIISIKYPAWMVEHRNHICYMTHRLRGVYDSFPGEVTIGRYLKELPHACRLGGIYMRKVVHMMDDKALATDRIRRYLCISETVRSRNEYYPEGVDVQVVVPAPLMEGFYSQPGEYFLSVSRLDGPKRTDLIIKAFKQVETDKRLKIVGTGSQETALKMLAADDSRVEFLGHKSDIELLDLYARSLAVVFVPQDEDLGFITIEAMKSGKPVITCIDSGGSLEFVVDGVNGVITNPNAESLAQAIQRIVDDPEYAGGLGAKALASVEYINWENTVGILAEALGD